MMSFHVNFGNVYSDSYSLDPKHPCSLYAVLAEYQPEWKSSASSADAWKHGWPGARKSGVEWSGAHRDLGSRV